MTNTFISPDPTFANATIAGALTAGSAVLSGALSVGGTATLSGLILTASESFTPLTGASITLTKNYTSNYDPIDSNTVRILIDVLVKLDQQFCLTQPPIKKL